MKRARLLIAAPAVAAALLLAGCSSDSGEDAATSETVEETEEAAPEEEVVEEEVVEEEVVEESDGGAADAVANAEAAIEAAKAIPATDDLGEPIDISSLAGTEIISIPIDSALEFYQAGEAAMKAIAEDAGFEYSTFPTDGSPTSFQPPSTFRIRVHPRSTARRTRLLHHSTTVCVSRVCTPSLISGESQCKH